MTFLTTDYSNLERNTGFEALPKGSYEMIIKSADIKSSKAGREYINIQMVVRNDLDKVPNLEKTNGKYHNRIVFASIYTDKETNQYKNDDLLFYLEAAQVPEGTTIESMQQFLDLLKNKPVKAYVTQSQNTYNGETKTQNNVWANNVDKTNFPQVNHTFDKQNSTNDPFNGATTNNGQPLNVDNTAENLPF